MAEDFNKEETLKGIADGTIRIRKLTPRECWRLQGFSTRRADGTFDDTYFERAERVMSNSQLYKQAGNSIAVSCLEGIFASLFCQSSVINYDE